MPLFGRKKNDEVVDATVEESVLDDEMDATEIDEDLDDVELVDEADDIDDKADDLAADDELEELDANDADAPDEWDELDASQDWRDDGPFDLDEVDLDDDPHTRVDFGTLILTPFQDMQLQLQVDQTTGIVQTALAMKGNSGLEVALFAAPRSGGLAREVRREMLQQAVASGGQGELAAGPFGTEVRRIIPMQAPDGQQAAHVSRTWLAEGPRWLLRGVLMGEVCLSEEEQAAHEFVEFFKNIIVRRGSTPMPQGDLIPMTLPDELRQEQ